MTEQQHPIVPPPELVEKWYCHTPLDRGLTLATWAAQWGADQELEACCEWLCEDAIPNTSNRLRAARRPKPPSLKEQALETLKYPKDLWSQAEVDTIRQALEALPND
jgi:hypothetical protein